jgi:hypothetical protein
MFYQAMILVLYIRSVVVGSGTVDGDTQSTTGTSDLTTAIAATPDTTAPPSPVFPQPLPMAHIRLVRP